MKNTLKNCIDSLKKQSFEDYEVIVVDDGSIDDTESIFKSIDKKFRYFKQENQGPASLSAWLQTGKTIWFSLKVRKRAWLLFFHVNRVSSSRRRLHPPNPRFLLQFPC